MRVFVAAQRGFCAGVKRAVDTAFSVPPEHTYILGELIHNEEIVARLEERGVRTVESVSEVPPGARLIIRSHGAGNAVFEECRARGIEIVDCTCPFVARTQRIVERAQAAGKTVAVAGSRGHPEVEGLIGHCKGEAFVFADENADFSVLAGKEVVLVSQTTFSEQRFCKITQNLQKQRPKTVEIFKTICYTTVCRQREAERLSRMCDAVIVLGGAHSSNTAKLCEIASAGCGNVIRLTRPDDFKYEKIQFYESVGVIAGASTPDWQTQEVLFKMAENNAEVQEMTSVVEEGVAAEAAAPAAEEVAAPEAPAEEAAEAVVPAPATEEAAPAAPAAPKSEMEQAVEAFERNERYKKGQRISAKIVSATDEGVYVSASGKLEILLAKDEIDCEEYSKEAYEARVGSDIDLIVVEIAPKVKVSEKAMRKIKEEEALLADVAAGKEFTVTCTGFNKGGLTAELGTYPVFIPAREIRSGYVKELDKYVGKKLRLKVQKPEDIRRTGRKEIIASQRVILEAERAEREAQKAEREAAFFASIHVGDVVEGKVERVTSFGAFVSVNGFDCLAHISDLSWTSVKAVTDVLEIGKRYEFKVLKVDEANKKVSIGYKQLQPQPWDLAAEKYAEGDIVHGKVVRIAPFGAFVELEKGIDGLVHVSQITHEWLENPTSALTIGEEVDAKVIAFNPAERKITLSIKALQPRPEYEHESRREREDGGKPQRGGRKGGRRASAETGEDDEYREWKDDGFSGASISELLGGSDEDK